jgi:hypothetical protein
MQKAAQIDLPCCREHQYTAACRAFATQNSPDAQQAPYAAQELPDHPEVHQHGPAMDAAVASLHVPEVFRTAKG